MAEHIDEDNLPQALGGKLVRVRVRLPNPNPNPNPNPKPNPSQALGGKHPPKGPPAFGFL